MSRDWKWKHVIVDDNDECYWERAWKKLYKISCDYAKSKKELSEFLDLLSEEEE